MSTAFTLLEFPKGSLELYERSGTFDLDYVNIVNSPDAMDDFTIAYALPLSEISVLRDKLNYVLSCYGEEQS